MVMLEDCLGISKDSPTCTVADALVFDNVVTVQGADGLDFSLEICHGGLLVRLKFLDSDQFSSVITPRVVTTKLNTAKVTLNTHLNTVQARSQHGKKGCSFLPHFGL